MKERILRFAAGFFWYFLIPVVLALVTFSLITPGDADFPTGMLGKIRLKVSQQPVPVLILLFVAFEMFLYSKRYSLPLAQTTGLAGRPGLPASLRAEYEDASRVVVEGRTLLAQVNESFVAKQGEDAWEAMNTLFTRLEQEVSKERFDGAAFESAYSACCLALEKDLAPWTPEQKSEAREFGESIFIAVGIAVLLKVFVIEAFQIPSGSMLPTLQLQDHLFVNKLAYGLSMPFSDEKIIGESEPDYGDIIVFTNPRENKRAPDETYIKRVIGRPGDVIEVNEGFPIVNGFEIPHCRVGDYKYIGNAQFSESADLYVEFYGDEAYLVQFLGGRNQGEREGPFKVPEKEFFMMGDNRDNSRDSRAWNQNRGAAVELDTVKGRALFIWLAFSKYGDHFLGVTWDRLFSAVMGDPRLPSEADESLHAAIKKCLDERPSQTTPPPPTQ